MAKARAFEKSPEFQHFTNVMKRLISVPKEELDEEVRRHQEQARANPNRPGPKPKRRVKAK